MFSTPLPPPAAHPPARVRGFTLIELIGVLLIIGVLATVAVVVSSQLTDRAHQARAQADLRNLTTAVLAEVALTSPDVLDRELVTGVLETSFGAEVTDGLGATTQWELLTSGDVPEHPGQLAVAFDNGDNVVSDTAGTRVLFALAGAPGSVFMHAVTTAGASCAPAGVSGAVTPGAVLADVAAMGTCHGAPAGEPGDAEGEAPAVAPDAPLNVAVDTGSHPTYTVTWEAVALDAAHVVEVSDGTDTFKQTAPIGSSSVAFTGLTTGVTYDVAVTALRDELSSSPALGTFTTYLAPPTGVSVTDYNPVYWVGFTRGDLTASTEVVLHLGDSAAGPEVDRTYTPTGSYVTFEISNPGTTYTLVLTTFRGENHSAPVEYTFTTQAAPPGAPTNLTTGYWVEPFQIFWWDPVPGATEYLVTVTDSESNVKATSGRLTDPAWHLDTLTKGDSYTVSVVAFTADSPPSSPTTLTFVALTGS